MAATGWLAESSKRTGVVPQSESVTAWLWGICHEPLTASVDASRLTRDRTYFCVKEACVPVVTKIVLVDVSRLGEVQMPPPTSPLGTTLKVAATWWLVRFTRSSSPCTTEQSRRLESPMYADPLEISGLDQL